MPYGDFDGLPRRTASDKVSREKTLNIAKYSKYDWYQRGLTLIAYNFLTENLLAIILQEVLLKMSNQQLAKEVYKANYNHFSKTIFIRQSSKYAINK